MRPDAEAAIRWFPRQSRALIEDVHVSSVYAWSQAATPQSATPQPAAPKRAKRSSALLLPLGFFAVTLLLIAAHQSRLLELFYPAAAALVGVVLYRRYPANYMSFLCWLYFLTPEVRRFADFYKGSFTQTSTIMIAPMIVGAISGVALLTHWKVLGQRRGAPMLMVIAGVAYAFIVGVFRNTPAAAAFAAASYALPVLAGFQMVVNWRSYPEYQRIIPRTFAWGLIVMGAYGIYQFVVMPPWDVFWLLNSGMNSEGSPVPFGIRVSSTMNSTGPYAITAMAGLIFLPAMTARTRWLAGALGLLSFLFTSVRAAWGGFLLGLIYTFLTLDNRKRFRLLLSIAVTVALAMPLLMINSFSDRLVERFQTLNDIKGDNSFNDRTQFYDKFMSVALTDIAGQGMGSVGGATKLTTRNNELGKYGNFDSGLMELPFVLGWPGLLLFVGGVLWQVARSLRLSRKMPRDQVAAAGFGTAWAILCMLVFINTLAGLSGTFFYIGAMLPVIGYRHMRSVRAQQP
jgi:hypothetical protein